jgi:hypothetical protein
VISAVVGILNPCCLQKAKIKIAAKRTDAHRFLR